MSRSSADAHRQKAGSNIRRAGWAEVRGCHAAGCPRAYSSRRWKTSSRDGRRRNWRRVSRGRSCAAARFAEKRLRRHARPRLGRPSAARRRPTEAATDELLLTSVHHRPPSCSFCPWMLSARRAMSSASSSLQRGLSSSAASSSSSAGRSRFTVTSPPAYLPTKQPGSTRPAHHLDNSKTQFTCVSSSFGRASSLARLGLTN